MVRNLLFLLFLLSGIISGCSGVTETSSPVVTPAQNEPDYCSSISSFTGSTINITATAQFQYRAISLSTNCSSDGSSTTVCLSGDPQIATIKYAEVAIKNSSGTTIQCGETDSTGNISITIPKTSGTYSIYIYSRSANSKLKASVLKDITSNEPYSITQSFTISSSDSTTKALGNIIAKARQSESSAIEGGAFNILNTLLVGNDFLRTKLSDSSFVAPKMQVYWKAGFNPATYFGESSLISFYNTGTSNLYILGGSNGDVKSTDTDHFDNSIILHEYGHFLEDTYGKSDSPGGAHYGVYLIDPRLAWSEGWAHYFQGAALQWYYGLSSQDWYISADTRGFQGDSVEGGTKVSGFYFPLTGNGATASYDSVSVDGEGVYREVSVARSLFKTTDTAHSYAVSASFSKIWSVFTSYFHSATTHFRNSGAFFEQLYPNLSSGEQSSFTTNVLTNEKQKRTTASYADSLNLVTLGSCSNTKSMNPVIESSINEYMYYMKSNHYYTLDNSLGTIKSIQLYIVSNTSPYIDLDLLLYKEDHTLSDELDISSNSAIATKSTTTQSGDTSGTTVESMSVSSLSNAVYLLNVKAKVYGKTTAQLGSVTYKLRYTNASNVQGDLCPQNP